MLRRALLIGTGKCGASVQLSIQQFRSIKCGRILKQCDGTARVRYVKAIEAANESYNSKNQRMGRPLAPALSVYSKQLTTILSITNRLSAIFLSMQVAAAGLACLWACRNNRTFEDFMQRMQSYRLENRGIFVMKSLIAFPIAYHTCMGLRHLLWDSGRYLSLQGVYRSGYLALVAAFLLTGIMGAQGRHKPKDSKKP